MEDEIEEILKNTNKQGEKIAINNLRHKPKVDARVVDEETIARLKNVHPPRLSSRNSCYRTIPSPPRPCGATTARSAGGSP